MLKISGQMTEVLRNLEILYHMLETCGHTLENLSNLEICYVMIEKQIYYFCTIKVSGHMLEVSRHT